MGKPLSRAAYLILLGLAGCAGPHGEKPHLDNAVARPNNGEYSFSGGYYGATAGTGLKNDPGAGPDPHF